MRRNQEKLRAQGIIEYLLLFAVVIIVVIFMLRPDGLLTDAVNKVLDDSVKEVEDMASCVRFCGSTGATPCPPICPNGCCEPGEDATTCAIDCAGCIPNPPCVGMCGWQPNADGCGTGMDCGPCPCVTDHVENTVCGNYVFSGGVPSGTTVGPIACPAGCDGTMQATCTDGTWSGSNTCSPADCPVLPINIAGCGSTAMPNSNSRPGVPYTIACPGTCSGTISVECSFGTWGPISNTCAPTQCPTNTVNVGAPCGAGSSVTFPVSPISPPNHTQPCPGLCNPTRSVVAACRTDGTWGPANTSACCVLRDGGWSNWNLGTWSACSGGFQTKIDTRRCNNPAPACGGAECVCGTGVCSGTGASKIETRTTTRSCCGNGIIDSGETCVTCRQDVGNCAGTGCASCPIGWENITPLYLTSTTRRCIRPSGYSYGEYSQSCGWSRYPGCDSAQSAVHAVCYTDLRDAYGQITSSTNYSWRFRP